jgi:hypothetical protein
MEPTRNFTKLEENEEEMEKYGRYWILANYFDESDE